MAMLEFVAQGTRDECGVACVAMLAGVSLARSRRAFSFLDEIGKTYSSDVRQALREFNLRLGRGVACNDWSMIRRNARRALVAVNRKRVGRSFTWHWVVYDASRLIQPILDPAFLRVGFIPLRPFFYHHVHYDQQRQARMNL
jgi:hypothetical protein